MDSNIQNPAPAGGSDQRLVRLLDIRPEQWPDVMPPGTQFLDMKTREWKEGYSGWSRLTAMGLLSHPKDPRGTMSLRIPQPNH